MNGHDEERDQLREGVSCAVLLERMQPGWMIDKEQSTPKCLKYRRGPGEVLIINHNGRGWWRPTSETDKGDVFSLAQHLDPRLNFGQVRKLLRGMIGMKPSYAVVERQRDKPLQPVAQRWAQRRRLSRGSATWGYLTSTRAIPLAVLTAADRFDAVREGPRGSAWFIHRDHAGVLTGIDMRGPDWRGFSEGGDKSLFRLPGSMGGDGEGSTRESAWNAIAGAPTRLVVCEAPIDALSLAALEGVRADTLYVATTGGMGPLTLACLDALLRELAARPGSVLVAATDADQAGDHYAARLAELALAAGVRSERLRPVHGLNDWNDQLKQESGL